MRILIVSTSENAGGAAVAANRLMEALNNNGEKAKMLVRDKQTDNISVVQFRDTWRQKVKFLWERFIIFRWLHFDRTNLFGLDTGSVGTDITRLREFKDADVVHLHWINQGMLSLKNIRKIVESGKPVVWTLHDAWATTGICHVTLGCRRFLSRCSDCKYLPNGGSADDLSAKVWKKKQQVYNKSGIIFVACSRWLETEAKKSALLAGQRILSIPNPIDTRIFNPGDKEEIRRELQLPVHKKLILFVAQRTTNPLKGMQYLEDACKLLTEKHSALKEECVLVLLGAESNETEMQTAGLETIAVPYTSDTHRIANLYRAADVFVLPSLSENLPNTIMEALACGLPCVSFRVGGIPEMIDHKKNGYLAQYRSAEDLARGIEWILCEADVAQLSAEAVKKVARNYSQQAVALEYIELYNEAVASKHFRL